MLLNMAYIVFLRGYFIKRNDKFEWLKSVNYKLALKLTNLYGSIKISIYFTNKFHWSNNGHDVNSYSNCQKKNILKLKLFAHKC